MPERIDLRPGPTTRRAAALVLPRALVEVRGDILGAAGTTRPVAFGRRWTVLAGDRNVMLAEIALAGLEPLTLEVIGTLQADGTLSAQAVLTLGDRRIEAVSTVVQDGAPAVFDVQLCDGPRWIARAAGSIANRSRALS